ncbi:unnamed protein product [Ceutorhynchus assimilis]|uniref:Geranylgeranyl transferase type-2 subunit beta n=1 Tax=Ceutorhynchus assimilis TaxID=467358 RepID=A0A9N9QQ30_9CUCU|nr:unnamed protein product [Ceutorhynchus assimilis]
MATLKKDIQLPENLVKKILFKKHIDFINEYGKDENNFEYGMTDYLRVSGMYWGLTALELMKAQPVQSKDHIIAYIKQCQDPQSGGISACIGHDPHILHTLSAVQILAMYDKLDAIDCEGVVKYVQSLQQPDGSFSGDKWGEIDTRFSFCSVMTLTLLKKEDAVDLDKAVEFVQSWGLNGRPEKLPDVCYSWWVLASLAILGRLHWIDGEALKNFIFACQDTETGGFADRPGDVADPFHTVFGIAALSLLGQENVQKVNPTYCMPQHVIKRMGLNPEILS